MKKNILTLMIFLLHTSLVAQSSVSSVAGVDVFSASEKDPASTTINVESQKNEQGRAIQPLTILEESYSIMAGESLRLVGRDQLSTRSMYNSALGSVTYRLGPGDKVQVFLWGESIDLSLVQNPNFPTNYPATVGSDGALTVPSLGRFSVQGLTLGESRELLRSEIQKRYKRFDISISLSEPRQQTVWVTGFVDKPGLTAVPPGASVLEALAAAGGLTDQGTLRKIEVWSSGVKKTVDLYPLLFGGESSHVLVADGDRIVVGSLGSTVSITGAVGRPGIYEVTSQPTLEDLIGLAGGLSVFADRSKIQIYRATSEGVNILNSEIKLESGDLISIPSKTMVFQNRVSVEGPVRFSGDYAFNDGLDLKKLMTEVQILPNYNPYYAEIKRLSEPGRPQFLTFNLSKVLKGLQNFSLKPGDEITLYRLEDDLSDRFDKAYDNLITVSGNLRYKGPVAFVEGLKVSDIVSNFDLLPETDLSTLEILRSEAPEFIIKVINLKLSDVIQGKSDFNLKARDRLNFLPLRSNQGIRVIGLVKETRFREYTAGIDLLEVLKGVEFTKSVGDLQAIILRSPSRAQTIFVKDSSLALTTTQSESVLASDNNGTQIVTPASSTSSLPKTSTTINNTNFEPSFKSIQNLPENRIPDYNNVSLISGIKINLKQFFSNPKAMEIARELKPGDVVYIQEVPEEDRLTKVTVAGAVKLPAVYYLKPGERISEILERAGGYTDRAFPEGLVFTRESIRKSQSQQLEVTVASLRQQIQDANEELISQVSTKDAATLVAINGKIASQNSQLKALESQKVQILGRLALSLPKTLEEFKNNLVENVTLEEDDFIFVPETPEYVLILGETYNPVSVPYAPGRRLWDYLEQTGGATTRGDMDEIYIIKANGRIVSPRTRNGFLWFKANLFNEVMGPGDSVVIPPKTEIAADWLTPVRDVTTIISQVASTTMSAVALFNTLQ